MELFSGISMKHLCNQLKFNGSVTDYEGNALSGFKLAMHALNHFRSAQDRKKILEVLTEVIDPQFDPLLPLDDKGSRGVSILAKALPKHAILTSDSEDVVIFIMNEWFSGPCNEELKDSENPVYILARSGNYKAVCEALKIGVPFNTDTLSEMVINGFPQKHAIKDGTQASFLEYCGLNLVMLINEKAINPNYCHKTSGLNLFDIIRTEGNDLLHETILAAALKTKITDRAYLAENIRSIESELKQNRSTARMM